MWLQNTSGTKINHFKIRRLEFDLFDLIDHDSADKYPHIHQVSILTFCDYLDSKIEENTACEDKYTLLKH